MTESPDLHYYLVLAGPTSAALSSRGMTRPAVIAAVYLFDAMQLLAEQRQGRPGRRLLQRREFAMASRRDLSNRHVPCPGDHRRATPPA